ncbi:MAG: fimbrial protein [Prevotella sp.]|nr:fimbrial protein [Prevotella sp.]
MKIRQIILQIFPTALLFTLVAAGSLSLNSCSSDYEENEDNVMEEAEKSVNLHFNLSLQSLTRADRTRSTEVGSSEENAINNYGIYFFDSDNKYIATFSANNFTSSDEENTSYSVSGKVDASTIKKLGSSFKIVVLANWDTYPSLVEGSTTIDNICSATTAVFTCPTTFETVPSIPFYGVHSYTGVTFDSDNGTTLDGSITLLRAMAKVEVIDKSITRADYYETIKSAKIYHYNKTGYCAPTGIYSQDDYGQGDDGDIYFVNSLHLVSGSNDSEQNERVLDLYQSDEGTWVAYIPEYSNIASSEDNCYIELELENNIGSYYRVELDDGIIANSSDNSFNLYFSEDGTSEATPIDIQRNKIYRFNVTLISTINGWYIKKR